MADDKKKAPDKKPPESTPPLQELTYLLGGLFILALILGQISYYFHSLGWGNINTVWNYILYSYILPLWHNWKYIAVLLSTMAVAWFVYSYKKLQEVVAEEDKVYGPHPHKDSLIDEIAQKPKNENWERVIEHLHADNSSDWRLAIMEADILLEETLRIKGFPGETIGDMLKSAQPGDFQTLDAAWEAHKVRNRIAHDGSNFELNEREAFRVIMLFEAVFKEFGVV